MNTVQADLQVSQSDTPARITGADGKTYAATREAESEFVDAELVDEPTHREPPKQKRRPLPEAFTDVGRDLTRAAERLDQALL